jgi:hypothetical protein
LIEFLIDQSMAPAGAGLGRNHSRRVCAPERLAFFVLAPPWLKISYIRNMPL